MITAVELPPAPDTILGVRAGRFPDALRMPWWWARTVWRSWWQSLVLLAGVVLVLAGTIIPLSLDKPETARTFLLQLAGLVIVGLLAMVLIWWYFIRSKYRVVYFTDRAAIVLKVTHDKGELRWIAGEHIGVRKGDGYILRELMRPALVDAADRAGAKIWGRAATRKLAVKYLEHLENWGLKAVPGHTREVERIPCGPQSSTPPVSKSPTDPTYLERSSSTAHPR